MELLQHLEGSPWYMAVTEEGHGERPGKVLAILKEAGLKLMKTSVSYTRKN